MAQKLFKCEELTNEKANTRIETHLPTGFTFAYLIGIIALISIILLLGISALQCKKNCTRPKSNHSQNIMTDEMNSTVLTI